MEKGKRVHDFTSENYKKKMTPLIRAEFDAAWIDWNMAISEAVKDGFDLKNIPEGVLFMKDLKMKEWTSNMISSCLNAHGASMIQTIEQELGAN